MNVKFELLKKEIFEAENIYDIVVAIYKLLDDEYVPSYIREYYRALNSDDKITMECKGINCLLEQVLEETIEFEQFKQILLVYVSGMQSETFWAVSILKYFDEIAREKDKYPLLRFSKESSIKRVFTIGPLNVNDQNYLLYMNNTSCFAQNSEIMKNMRMMGEPDNSNLNSLLKYYHIGKKIDNLPRVYIKDYPGDYFKKSFLDEDSQIKIAIVPFSKNIWYDVDFEELGDEKNYLYIREKEENVEDINNKYILTLEQASKNNVDIVIFPELCMNSQTKKCVQKWLAQKSLLEREFSIKLVFLGSLWKENINECCLLSGTGIELIKNSKRIGFVYKKDNKKYQEFLGKKPERYELIDISYLGRVLYLICRDAVEDLDQSIFWNQYNVNLEVISCYSPSIQFFKQEMDHFVKNKIGFAILANCCEPRISLKNQEEEIGFLAVPAMSKTAGNSSTFTQIHPYGKIEHCENECDICDCKHLFTIYPHRCYETEEYKEVLVEHNILIN